jgi:hypothetical protein
VNSRQHNSDPTDLPLADTTRNPGKAITEPYISGAPVDNSIFIIKINVLFDTAKAGDMRRDDRFAIKEKYVNYPARGGILEDEHNRNFNAALSSRLIEFTDKCFFCTRNTLYILVGSGKRRSIHPKVISSMLSDFWVPVEWTH